VARTDARLQALFAEQRALAEATSPEAAELVEALQALTMRGAKRLRAAALWAGYAAVAGPSADPTRTAHACAALELLQSYFLIQDDWMDGDEQRRGGPAVHVALTRARGDAHLGASLAMLAADLGCGLAFELIATAPFPAARRREGIAAFGRMHFEVVCGQQLDLLGHADVSLVHRLKTGSYTVRGPLRLGALLADASAAQLSALDRFAEPLGLAFQLRDDLLGVFGSSAATGKPVGADLRAGKQTALLADARPRLDAEGSARLEGVLGNRDATDAQVAAATEALSRTGARERLETRLAELLARALGVLDGGALQVEGVAMLRALAERLVQRER
jgi:geranylgeranyl diphosphate synthase type I